MINQELIKFKCKDDDCPNPNNIPSVTDMIT